jgi:Flp pilus assembly protein TadB
MINNIDDISERKREEEKEKKKAEISDDINDVFEKTLIKVQDTLKRRQIEKEQKEKKGKGVVRKSMDIFLMFLIFLLLLNFLLFNVWAIKFFIKSLFLTP